MNLRLCHRGTDHRTHPLPNLKRIVLHPATLRENLRVLALVKGNDIAIVVKEHKTAAGCALVDGTDVLGHDKSPGMMGGWVILTG